MSNAAPDATVADVLRARARQAPDRLAFRELRNDLGERDRVTYAELNRRAARLAMRIAARVAPGGRALLLAPGAIDYLTALFACFYAGVVAVSGSPPYAPSQRSERHAARLERLRGVIKTSGAAAVLGPADLLERVQDALGEAGASLALIASDQDGIVGAADPGGGCDPDAIAMLQYTSGSTTSPGGVVLRHRNLAGNLAAQAAAFALTEDDVGVSWLPLFHDLGLIGAGLAPIWAGFPCTLLPAAGFVEQPRRWLQCISDARGTISWAPDFGYRLCLKAIAPQERPRLDLASWRIAMNAAEPVRAETVRGFAEGFAVSGFSPSAMFPAYGLAEATLVVTAPDPGEPVSTLRVDAAALARDRIEPPVLGAAPAELVACGRPIAGVAVAIVNPATGRRCPPDMVGEIWVSGPATSEGYFGETDRRAASFGARLPGEAEPWLRTGDLGFVVDGRLFVTGRLKDLIILRGANIYPHDLELTAAASHPALRDDCACAFPVTANGEEALGIVCEIGRKREEEAAEAVRAVRHAVLERHGLEAQAVVIVRFGTVPKTPSGKLQRRLCRQALETGRLAVVLDDWLEPPAGAPAAPARAFDLAVAEGVAGWVLWRLGEAAPGATVELGADLADLGLSSVQVTELAGEIERVFGRRIAAADLFELRRVCDIVEQLLATRPQADRNSGAAKAGLG